MVPVPKVAYFDSMDISRGTRSLLRLLFAAGVVITAFDRKGWLSPLFRIRVLGRCGLRFRFCRHDSFPRSLEEVLEQRADGKRLAGMGGR